MTIHEIRQAYFDMLLEKEHVILSSSSLLPENDPTTLFTGSGMQPMVPYLLGQDHPSGKRIANAQKCFRAVDIEEVGDNRHTTFFEMLGNWSLGDYFKKEQIVWVFDFLVHTIGLNPKQLYVSVFSGDDGIGIPRDEEAVVLWQERFGGVGVDAKAVDNVEKDGLQGGRICYYDEKENWWSRAGTPEHMPVGEPGGPDSEIFWDFGKEHEIHEQSKWKDQQCHPACDCGRFMEIGNNVFMAYRKTAEGFVELDKKNIDFGGGLERIAAACNGNPDVFSTDVFTGARNMLTNLSGKVYGANEKETFAFRVILDHVRAAVFLIGDGALPSNKDQGYFTRRLVRRAIRFARDLGINTQFCGEVAVQYITEYTEAYPQLHAQEGVILDVLRQEETKFRKTLDGGMKEFGKLLKGFTIALERTGKHITEISGKQAFRLYDTYGFPLEMTQELANEHGLVVDTKGFDSAFLQHKNTSRSASEKKFKGGLADTSDMSIKYHTATHLLHIALKRVLGDHVEQKGSNITPDRLRFDFTHSEKMTDDQKKEIERIINAAIEKNYPITFLEMSVEEAKKQGAIGLFGETYGDIVKVYTVGEPNAKAEGDPEASAFSKEICGGPHVERTGLLGHFRIKKEESSSAGIRRIKAILE